MPAPARGILAFAIAPHFRPIQDGLEPSAKPTRRLGSHGPKLASGFAEGVGNVLLQDLHDQPRVDDRHRERADDGLCVGGERRLPRCLALRHPARFALIEANDWLAALTVCCELVSGVNSLLTGKSSGIWPVSRSSYLGPDGTDVTKARAFLSPAVSDRPRMKQGSLGELSGKAWDRNSEYTCGEGHT
jgi:hypothetical protein